MRNKPIKILVEVDKLKELYELLGKDGINSKAVVREEIGKMLRGEKCERRIDQRDRT